MKPSPARFALAVFSLLTLAAGTAGAESALNSLSGTLRVFMCDGGRCDRPADDAPGWRAYEFGPQGTVDPVRHREGVGWVVATFSLTPGLAALQDPALLLTTPADAEIAALNGVSAGGDGVIGPQYHAVPNGPRILLLPRAAMHSGSNELTLQVLFAGMNANAFSGPLYLGERARIELESERLRRHFLTTESAFMSLFLVMIVFFVFLISRGVVRSDYVLFLIFLALYTTEFALDSHLLHIAGLCSPWTERAQALITRSVSLVVLSLVTTVTGQRFGRLFATLATPPAVLLAAQFVLPPLQALRWLAVPRKAVLGALGLYYLFLAARAVHQRRPDALPAFFGVAAYVAGSRVDLYWGIAARDYGTGIFALAMLYTITSRHARLRARIEDISAQLLDAHEQERTRIARDIHDSVGQSVLALRLKLQMLAGKGADLPAPVGEMLPALAAEAGAIVEDLRRTVLDLRPAISETEALWPALQSYASAIATQRGLEIRFHEGRQPLPELPSRTRTHLFRILQEMLTNVQRHSGATRVDISLHRDGAHLVLQVADNGVGFDPLHSDGGIGLATMRERAELLGGTLAVESAPARGTAVTVEVQLP